MTRVGVVAPGRSLPREAAEQVLTQASPLGVDLVFHPQCFFTSGHFAGTDDQRTDAFVEVANDPSFDAVWFARGGYGAGRILGKTLPDLGKPAAQKTYLGYSDAGYILAALSKNGIGRSVHGPLVADVLRTEGKVATERALRFFAGDGGDIEPHTNGPAAAFNLAILASLVATPYLPSLEGRVVMVEEVGEHLYAMDRDFFTVFASGALERATGLRLGRVSEVPENDIDFGETVEDMARRWCTAYGVPFLGQADIGHDVHNRIVPFG